MPKLFWLFNNIYFIFSTQFRDRGDILKVSRKLQIPQTFEENSKKPVTKHFDI